MLDIALDQSSVCSNQAAGGEVQESKKGSTGKFHFGCIAEVGRLKKPFFMERVEVEMLGQICARLVLFKV